MRKGEVTAFLSLIFILLLSVVASIVESASMQVLKNRKRGDMDRALESIFAEYQKDLLEEFDVFSLEGTYGTGEFSEENLTKRLESYGMKDAEQTVEKIQFLTDEEGRPFREQVIAYMKQKMGIAQMEELAGLSGEWKNQTGRKEEYDKEGTEIGQSLEDSLREAEQALPKENNPLDVISSIWKTGLVRIVMKGKEVSERTVSEGELLSNRSLQTGRGDFKVKEDTIDMTSNLYFASYLIEKFHAADEPCEDGKLAYELEYILNGSNNDGENLEAVCRKLAGIRLVVNYGYLLTDEGKKAEAEALALVLAGIIALPSLTELIKQAILLAWAFGESVMDLRALLEGGRIPLTKSKEDWQLSLSGLLKLGTGEELGDGRDSEQGLSYKEYLRMLLIFEKQEECTMRSIGAVEMRMKKRAGEYFKADCCVSKMCVKARCGIRRNISYEFQTEYGYQ